ncbi:MAG TPA: DUF819 family protein [Calditrichia bacterium]|nr:DUF819 family protein [Calditrichota bacterium]HQU72187.1 DUF819 family protein [Calditrichia bacterium]HQV30825.1 DUF819 family protein [Calditrichia bacterium]
MEGPLLSNDAVIFGILTSILAFVFYTSSSDSPVWKRVYTFFPPVLACYFLPSLLNTLGIVDPDQSKLYFVSSRYLLPASLVLLTLSVDLRTILRLGYMPIVLFLTGTVGIIIGGPIALLIVSYLDPALVGGSGPDAIWRGMTTIAGSWIGGGANQTAMKEVFKVGDTIFSAMITVDIIVGNIWMAFLLYGAGMRDRIDKWLQADTRIIGEVQKRIESYWSEIAKIPALKDTALICAIGFGMTGLAHFGADLIAPFIQHHFPGAARFSLTSGFFWIIVIATTGGILLSFTKARDLEGAGASRIGSLLLYILVASIGMKMNVLAIFDNLSLFLVGVIWISIHAGLLILVARLLKAPLFFMAVGSQANVGGAASAPIVAAAFHPALAPIGVLLAVLGYAVGTYGAWICGLILQAIGN